MNIIMQNIAFFKIPKTAFLGISDDTVHFFFTFTQSPL